MSEYRPLVSIVTVVYNGELHLEKTIQSVLNQTYKRIEYIIIDGGSTDGTLKIIEKYKNKLMYWCSEPDNGIYNAMNKGISKCNGELIGLINADDWYELNAIENIVKCANGYDIIYGNVQLWKNDQSVLLIKSDHKRLRQGMTVAHPSVFVRKQVYQRLGNFRENYKIVADYEFLTRLYINNLRFKSTKALIAHMNLGGLSDTNWIGAFTEELKIKNEYFSLAGNYYYYFKQLLHFIIKRRILSK